MQTFRLLGKEATKKLSLLSAKADMICDDRRLNTNSSSCVLKSHSLMTFASSKILKILKYSSL